MADSEPRRVMLWAHPRTLSTVLELALASRTTTKMFHEIYSVAYHFGDERLFPNPGVTVPGFSFQYVKDTLEADYTGKNVIICKDLPFCLDGKLERLPKGYLHTFLIRDPRRSLASMCKTYGATDTPLEHLPASGGVKAVYDLHKFVTTELKQDSIIIDAHDLSHHPESIIKKYCTATGIPFEDSYLSWKPGNIHHFPDIYKHPVLQDTCFSSAVNSTNFKPLPDQHAVDVSQLPHQARIRIDEALPYYKELFERRILP
ncbi:uncharacterized protein LOC144435966 [Glandiceps talaboti]